MDASRSFADIRNQTASALRYDGFHAAMTAAGLAVDPALIQQGYFTYRSGLEATEKLLTRKNPPTAISPATTTWPLRQSRSPTAVVWMCRATSPSSVSTTLLLRRPSGRSSASARTDARVVSDHVMAHVLIKRDSVAAPCKE
jgi:LacI family transcriptional regulator